MTPGGGPGHLGFVGVSTSGSAIHRVSPRWADELGLPTRALIGHDIPLGAPAQRFRDVVHLIRTDPDHRGALVTTHTMALFEAARDCFDDLDDLAVTFGGVSSITRRGDRLTGRRRIP